MSEIGHLKTEAAKLTPEEYFTRPLDIVEEVMLTRGEKLATLERWRKHILQELQAGDEGMPTRGTSPRHHDTLQEIEQARQLLEAQHDTSA
jgi:hypothetical protein